MAERTEYILSKKGEDKKKYDKAAARYDFFEFPMEVLAFSKWRKLLFGKVEGELILEVGIGTGKNIPYYSNGEYIGIDISRKMLEKAKDRVEKLGRKIDLIQCDAELLPFRDEVFDAIVSTYVFCSVENPVRGLKELYRVLKPNGRVYFLEHMRCENEIGGKVLDALNPIARLFGPEINRRTVENIRKAGFKIAEEKWLLTSVFRFIVAEKG
jgi:demethylmenaquinone methyltransferase/2-methoxy-6-polyprenyl-1,4-benzoquinol methylase